MNLQDQINVNLPKILTLIVASGLLGLNIYTVFQAKQLFDYYENFSKESEQELVVRKIIKAEDAERIFSELESKSNFSNKDYVTQETSDHTDIFKADYNREALINHLNAEYSRDNSRAN